MVEVSVSLLDLEEKDSIKNLYNLETSGINYFHIDVMDGKFVEKDTTDKMHKFSNYIKQISTLPIDVHLMVENVKEFVDEYSGIEPRIITFHLEAMKDSKETIDIIKYIKNLGINVGISIKPDTKLNELYEFLPYIHLVLIMTVEPGKGGQKLMEPMIKKIKELKEYITKNNIDILIEADGGINVENSKKLQDAGLDILVAGSAILKSDNYKETVRLLKA